MSELRKCEVRRAYESPQQGRFHQWGSKIAYGESNDAHTVTFGIVELETGEVVQASPDSITFKS